MSDVLLYKNLEGYLDVDLTGKSASLVAGNEAVAQEISIAMRFFKGEWFLDTRVGIKYFEEILGKKPRPDTVAVIYRQALFSIPGVTSVDSVLVNIDSITRTANVDWRCATDSGEIIEGSEALVLP